MPKKVVIFLYSFSPKSRLLEFHKLANTTKEETKLILNRLDESGKMNNAAGTQNNKPKRTVSVISPKKFGNTR